MKLIILEGKPLSTQHVYKIRGFGKGMYMTEEGKNLKESYYWQAKKQWGREKPRQDEIELWVKLYHGDKRVRDIDNYSKLLFDSLTGVVYEDDKQIVNLHLEKLIDIKNPRIEIEVI